MVSESVAGNEIDGVYPVGAPIRRSARSAVYETEVSEGDGIVPAVIRIREVEPGEAEKAEESMRQAAELSHPNLLRVYASGSSVVSEVPVFYVVMERADESLEGVLAERALSESETREMLGPTLEALGYLHKKGYAHSRLRPSNVLAVNDRLKLSADRLVRANDGEAAEDMRALGLLIVQALGQTDVQDCSTISQPLAEIARHCLDPDPDRRWTVEQVKARLNSTGLLAETIAPEMSRAEDESPSSGIPKWIYAGLVALLLVVTVAALLRSTHPATTAATQAPPRILPAPPVERAPIAAAPSAPSAMGAPPISGKLDARKASGWSVVAGAYGSREAAEKRMRELAKKWPKFEINVYESHAEKTPYLVVLGRNLSEDQAEALRKRAVQAGLPRDTYIKRAM